MQNSIESSAMQSVNYEVEAPQKVTNSKYGQIIIHYTVHIWLTFTAFYHLFITQRLAVCNLVSSRTLERSGPNIILKNIL